MRLNKIQWLNGGFEIVNFKPPFSFEKRKMEGVLKGSVKNNAQNSLQALAE